MFRLLNAAGPITGNDFIKGSLLALFSGVCSGFIPIFALYAYQGQASVLTFIFLRTLIGASVYFLCLWRKSLSVRLSCSQLGCLFVMGGVLETIQSGLYLTSVKYLQASLVQLIFYTYPALVALLSFLLFREKPSQRTVAGIVISFIGLSMVLGASAGKANLLGMALAFGSALICSVIIILSYRLVREIDPLLVGSFLSLFTTLMVLPIGLLAKEISLAIEPKAWLAIIGYALVATTLARFCFLTSMKLIGSTLASLLSMVEPLVTVVFSALLFSQYLTWLQLLGGLIVLLGGAVASMREQA